MTTLVRAITCATLFIGLVLVFLPAQVLSRAGVAGPARFEAPQFAGTIVAATGAMLAIWCVLTFALVGRAGARNAEARESRDLVPDRRVDEEDTR